MDGPVVVGAAVVVMTAVVVGVADVVGADEGDDELHAAAITAVVIRITVINGRLLERDLMAVTLCEAFDVRIIRHHVGKRSDSCQDRAVETVKVTFVIEDAMPNRWVGPDVTPNLLELASTGGRCEAGGQAVMSSATYPNHASFVTGLQPTDHGVMVNRVWTGGEFVGSESIGPIGETIFEAARRAGMSTAALLGDHKLVGVTGAQVADVHWPPDGVRPDVELDEFQYAVNRAVIDAYDSHHPGPGAVDLTVVHFNDPDTACHLHGPDSAAARDRMRLTDADLGQLLERLRPEWDDTVVIVVSDHDQETVWGEGFDLAEEFRRKGLPGIVEPEGTCALIIDGPDTTTLMGLDGVDGAVVLDSSSTLVWGPEGQVFGLWFDFLHGAHGGPRCREQVAVVGGGHPVVAELADALNHRRPSAVDWAPTIADLCGFDLPGATGRSLLSGSSLSDRSVNRPAASPEG